MRQHGSFIAALSAMLCAISATAAGCTAAPAISKRATITVDVPAALVDQPVHVKITDLTPNEQVSVRAKADDAGGRQWQAEATFTADEHGAIDLDQARPTAGSYSEPDGMGLFWSMNPPDGDPLEQFFQPAQGPEFTVRLSATGRHGGELAATTLTRRWANSGVTNRELTLDADRVAGWLFLPPAGATPRPAVLLIGGSEGGASLTPTAALLASHGHPALAVAYFGEPGLPDRLQDIPIEYFASAAALLARQPGADPGRVIPLGYSRGTEAALLLAEHFPDAVHGLVLYSPSVLARPSFPNYSGHAWTLAGAAVGDELIPVDRIGGPVLAVAGADDALWPSATAAQTIMRNLDAANHRQPHRALIYPQAGHNVGTFPYLPQGTRLIHPVSGTLTWLGGTRPGTAAAQARSWPQVLALLANS